MIALEDKTGDRRKPWKWLRQSKKADKKKDSKKWKDGKSELSIIEEAIKQMHVQMNETREAVHALQAELASFRKPEGRDRGFRGSDGVGRVTNTNRQTLASVRCYACGRFGHMRRECRSQTQNARQRTSQSDGGKPAGRP